MNRFGNFSSSKFLLAATLSFSVAGLAACQKGENNDKESSKSEATKPGATTASKLTAPPSGPKPGDIPAPEDVAKPPADATKTEQGLFYKVLTPAATPGDKPTANDTVEVNYTGWTTDGKMFDSSVKRGKTVSFGVGKVIAGWTEGLQLMSVGEKTRFWIPQEMAYKGKPGAPKGMLVFDVELVSIKKAPATPKDVAGPPADAKKTELGVSYKILKSGSGGDKPKAWDKAKVDYTGWTTDGKMFDSSITRGRPATFPVNGVIPGWTDVLQQMAVGDKWLVWIPEELAYKGQKGRPAGMLVFEVELHDVTRMPEPPKVPANVAKPPKTAKKTELGVFYEVLKAGSGNKKPTPSDKVEVHYTGWTTDGKMFDSSITRGRTATFPLSAVIAGWTDGMQTMSVGGKTRFWIPEELAYKGQPGKPAGMLVFDVELISIKKPGASQMPPGHPSMLPHGVKPPTAKPATAKPVTTKPAASK